MLEEGLSEAALAGVLTDHLGLEVGEEARLELQQLLKVAEDVHQLLRREQVLSTPTLPEVALETRRGEGQTSVIENKYSPEPSSWMTIVSILLKISPSC